MALTLMVSVGGLGEFDCSFRSLKVGVCVPDDELPAHLAHPSVEVSLPLLDGESVEEAQREARVIVHGLINAQVLSDWIQKRRVGPSPTQISTEPTK